MRLHVIITAVTIILLLGAGFIGIKIYPAIQYQHAIKRLGEIRSEVKYPRDGADLEIMGLRITNDDIDLMKTDRVVAQIHHPKIPFDQLLQASWFRAAEGFSEE